MLINVHSSRSVSIIASALEIKTLYYTHMWPNFGVRRLYKETGGPSSHFLGWEDDTSGGFRIFKQGAKPPGRFIWDSNWGANIKAGAKINWGKAKIKTGRAKLDFSPFIPNVEPPLDAIYIYIHVYTCRIFVSIPLLIKN
jgi:hypothetical protein